jgi:two-component system chemotaxis response regulator CheY
MAYAAGANAYLVKPVKPDRFLIHIKLLIGEAA